MALVGVGGTKTDVQVKMNFDIKETGQKVEVKDDCRTKLMYYLNCFSGIPKFNQVHPEWVKYTKYKTCTSWTLEEEEELLHICKDEITLPVAQAVGFIEAPDELLGTSSNTFFDVTNTDEVLLNHVQVHIDENSIYAGCISAGAKRELKFKVMMYRRSWINENYHIPLSKLSDMIERHKEEIRRKLHNEEVINQNKHCCCIITDKEKTKHPNIVRFLLILYFIHTIALLVLYLNADKTYDEDRYAWVKWVNLAGVIVAIINCIFGLLSVVFVCISPFYHSWIVYIRLLIKVMVWLSVLSIPPSILISSNGMVSIILILMSFTLLSFSCSIYCDKRDNPRCTCLYCGVMKVAPEKIDYYL